MNVTAAAVQKGEPMKVDLPAAVFMSVVDARESTRGLPVAGGRHGPSTDIQFTLVMTAPLDEMRQILVAFR